MEAEKFDSPFKGRSLLNWIDWTPEEISQILEWAFLVKKQAHAGEVHQRREAPLRGGDDRHAIGIPRRQRPEARQSQQQRRQADDRFAH